MPTPEGALQAKIVDYLLRRPDVFFWRQNVGAAHMRGRYTQFGRKGCPDLIGIRMIRGVGGDLIGQFLGVEVKAPGRKQTPDQIEFEKFVRGKHGLYVLAYALVDVANALGPVTHTVV